MSVYQGPGWQAQRIRVLDRDGWICTACGKALDGADATVDHIDPQALNRGRDYTDDELAAMCRSCNSRKQDRVMVRMAWVNPRWLSSL